MTIHTRLLDSLRRESLTVNELCTRLGITRNAVNVQLRQLEAQGLVRRMDAAPTGMRGKPAVRYEAAPGSEDITSGAYRDLLMTLLRVLGTRLPRAKVGEVLEQTGRELARAAGLGGDKDFDGALRAAMAAANALGASTELQQQADGMLVRNYACPVASAVRAEPCVCRALAAFFSEATGQPAVEKCLRGDRLICQYLVQRPQPRRKATPAERAD